MTSRAGSIAPIWPNWSPTHQIDEDEARTLAHALAYDLAKSAYRF